MTRPLDKIVEAVQNAEPINWPEFCLAANRTVSGGVFPGGYPADTAVSLMEKFVEIGNELDKLKKALFYGKNMPRVADDHYDMFGDADRSYLTEEWPDNISDDTIHCILGAATESVELVEALLKSMISGEPLDAVNVMEETGDIYWYLTLPYMEGLQNNNFDPEERLQLVWRKVLLKLMTRFPNKFEADKAINRDTNIERKVLEEGIVQENGQIHNAVEQQLILTSESDVDTAIKALAALAEAEESLQRAHADLLTEAEQYTNMLFLHKMLPSEVAKLKMPFLSKKAIVQLAMAAPDTDIISG